MNQQQRINYWADYLNRLANYMATEESLSPLQIQRISNEVQHITQYLKVLSNAPARTHKSGSDLSPSNV
jgi:hypothetical protein